MMPRSGDNKIAGWTPFTRRRTPSKPIGRDALTELLAGIDLVSIGASAGGIEALNTIIKQWKRSLRVPCVVLQHLGSGTHYDFSQVFYSGPAHMPIKEAEDKERLENGVVYVAPPGYHLLLERDLSFALSVEASHNFSRPSIDIFFESASRCLGKRFLAIILTGANDDGAIGIKTVKDAGGLAIVQDPDEASMATMPRAALKLAKVDRIMSLHEIGCFLNDHLAN